MKLTSKEARELLEIERKNTMDDRWIEHCISVGDSAGRIAKALCEKEINVEKFILAQMFRMKETLKEYEKDRLGLTRQAFDEI